MPISPARESLIELVFEADPMVASLHPQYLEEAKRLGIDPARPPEGMSFDAFVLRQLTDENAARFVGHMGTVAEDDRKNREAARSRVHEHVGRIWELPLGLLDQIISLAEDFVAIFVALLESSLSDGTLVAERVLTMLLSRGVQVAEEILVLLRAGMAPGAEARWRTLHEMAVVAAFIALDEGDDTANRYLAHDRIKAYQRMKTEQEYHTRLGFDPYTAEELRAAKGEHDVLTKRYKPFFTGDFGWAFEALRRADPQRKPEPPRFKDLQDQVELGHYKVPYASASNAIHAGSSGLFDHPGENTLGLPSFITRASEHGLREPGVRTALSVVMLSRSLLLRVGAPYHLLGLLAMRKRVEQCITAFVRAEAKQEERATRATGQA